MNKFRNITPKFDSCYSVAFNFFFFSLKQSQHKLVGEGAPELKEQ